MIQIGVLKNFDSGTYKAGVQLAGSLTTYFDDISVAKNIPSSAMVIGNYVILAIPGGNPRDACVIASWPGGTPGGGSFLDLSDTPASYSGQAGKLPKVNDAEDALEFVRSLLAPTGTAEWKNRTYKGWELVTTATEYTIGSGQNFATLAAAAASLQGLILTASITLKLMEAITLTSTVTFKGLLSAGGGLTLDINGHDITINHNGVGIAADGQFGFYPRDKSGAPYGSIIAGPNAGGLTYLVRYMNYANGNTYHINLDANSKGIYTMLLVTNDARCLVYAGTDFLDTGAGGAYSNAVGIRYGGYVAGEVTLGVAADDLFIDSGGMVVDSAGHIHTEAGEFTP